MIILLEPALKKLGVGSGEKLPTSQLDEHDSHSKITVERSTSIDGPNGVLED